MSEVVSWTSDHIRARFNTSEVRQGFRDCGLLSCGLLVQVSTAQPLGHVFPKTPSAWITGDILGAALCVRVPLGCISVGLSVRLRDHRRPELLEGPCTASALPAAWDSFPGDEF